MLFYPDFKKQVNDVFSEMMDNEPKMIVNFVTCFSCVALHSFKELDDSFQVLIK
jgi:hypothetical protein